MKKTWKLTLAVCIFAVGIARANSTVYSDNLVNDTGLPVNTTYDLDLQLRGIGSASAVVTATSATLTSPSFNDGRAATGTFAVTTLTDLTTNFASNKLTVLTTASLSGSQIRLNGVPITEGLDWSVGTTSTATAIAIARALNTKFSGTITSTAPAASASVFSTAAVAGAAANAYTFTSSVSSISVSSATFFNGRDSAWVTIKDTKLTVNVDFAVGASTMATAVNLSSAINNNATLAPLVTASTGLAAKVTVTADAVGTTGNYGLTSSSPTAITVDGLVMRGGSAAAWTVGTTTISLPTHGLSTGLGVYLSTSGSVALSPLVWGTTYYIIKVDASSVQLALTSTGAVAGVPITLTSSATPTTTHTYTLNVPAITGTPSYKWQVSNDGTNFADYTTSAAGVTIASGTLASYTFGGAVQAWDFGKVNFHYLRFKVVAPTTGAMNIITNVIGKQD